LSENAWAGFNRYAPGSIIWIPVCGAYEMQANLAQCEESSKSLNPLASNTCLGWHHLTMTWHGRVCQNFVATFFAAIVIHDPALGRSIVSKCPLLAQRPIPYDESITRTVDVVPRISNERVKTAFLQQLLPRWCQGAVIQIRRSHIVKDLHQNLRHIPRPILVNK
jgi:hypothetical protein